MSEPLSEERLAAIRARCEAATSGPWTCFDDVDTLFSDKEEHWWCVTMQSELEENQNKIMDCYGRIQKEEDAEFMACARTDVPDLLAEVERLRAALTDIDSVDLCQHIPLLRLAKVMQQIAREALAPK